MDGDADEALHASQPGGRHAEVLVSVYGAITLAEAEKKLRAEGYATKRRGDLIVVLGKPIKRSK